VPNQQLQGQLIIINRCIVRREFVLSFTFFSAIKPKRMRVAENVVNMCKKCSMQSIAASRREGRRN
jgi:hypothetical protein